MGRKLLDPGEGVIGSNIVPSGTVRSGSFASKTQDVETSYQRRGSGKADPTNRFKRSWLRRRPAENLQIPSLLGFEKKPRRLRMFTTLKRVCPSEYQGAQGAFKDSMIH